MTRLIQQVCLVMLYSEKRKFIHLKKCDVKPTFIKVLILINSLLENYMELFPARQLNIMQSVIVANGKRQICVDSG